MDSCPAELIALILEQIPLVEFGKTARSLGLVSKYYRTVIKPFEYRTLVVMGIGQLKATLSMLKRAQADLSSSPTSDGSAIDVRHLYLCEIGPDSGPQEKPSVTSFMDDDDPGLLAAMHAEIKEYMTGIAEFRTSSVALVQIVSTTLVNLCVVRRRQSVYFNENSLDVLSEMSFPHLKNLILDHQKRNVFDLSFIPPIAPLLQRIHLGTLDFYEKISSVLDTERSLHPLLVNMHTHFGALTHLVLCGMCPQSSDELLVILRGSRNNVVESASMYTSSHRLPGRLIQAVLIPRYDFDQEQTDAKGSLEAARALSSCIDGLEVLEPYIYSENGKWERDALFLEWEELVRECRY